MINIIKYLIARDKAIYSTFIILDEISVCSLLHQIIGELASYISYSGLEITFDASSDVALY